MSYSKKLVDRVVDAMDSAQEYWTRNGLGEARYEVGYDGEPTDAYPDGEPIVVFACSSREEAVDARDVFASRARAVAALTAVDHVEPVRWLEADPDAT